MIGEEELQRMLTRREIEFDLGLPLPEVAVGRTLGDGQIQRRKFSVDDEVMMSGPGLLHAGGSDAHPMEAKADDQR